VFVVRPVPPFRLDLTVWALRRRSRNIIDRWDGSVYRRLVVINGQPVEVAIHQVGSPTEPQLIVKTTPSSLNAADRRCIRTILDRLLGLRVDLTGWYRIATRDTRLRPLARRFRGVKPPRFPTLFEALINAFACQQLSLDVGLELLNRLAMLCGVKARAGPEVHYGFPGPRDIAPLSVSRLRALGFSRQKISAMTALARAITREHLDLEVLDSESDDVVRQQLSGLRGVGRWTADYVLLRGLGRVHVFPGDDVGAQKSLAQWLGRARPFDYEGVHRATERWQPYAGMVYFHLLLERLRGRSDRPLHNDRSQPVLT
jgi:DNA-3-methyladenine glycosylase II